jgi:Arc/MetJ-type ribon-helix-helix transcriptional regulator
MKTTYRLPAALRVEMLAAVKEKYNVKSKSRWIREAINMLLDEDAALKDVGAGEELEKNDLLDTVDLGQELPGRIDIAIATLRRQDPLMEGVMASIIRASIRRRLLNWK